jgi:hypothetical protein
VKLYRNIIARWRTEIEPDVEGKKIFSPYLTSKIAESITNESSDAALEVYTLFSAELFSSKASSLTAIENIINQGHKVFHLPDLHAKMVVIPEKFCSVGSQNLTNKGQRNKEINVAFSRPQVIASLMRKIQPWLNERVEISTEMIEEMRIEVCKLEKKFLEILNSANAADNYVFERHRMRLVDREAARLRAIETSSRRSRFVTAVSRLPKSGAFAICTVREIVTSDWFTSSTMSLVCDPDRDLTMWEMEKERIDLDRGRRYLILLDDGNIGWARVMKTRISFVGVEINMQNEHFGNGKSYRVGVRSENHSKSIFGNNVRFEVSDPLSTELVRVYCWFDGESMEITAITDREGVELSDLPSAFGWISSNKKSFCKRLGHIISSPFLYESKLYGLNAMKFFGPKNSSIKIQLARVEGNPILIAQRIWPPYE